MRTGNNNETPQGEDSAFQRFISGQTFGLAPTYWALFLVVAVLYFVFGSIAVADRNWPPYLAMLAATVAWSFVLLLGVQRYYKGNDPGKALARIAMLFLMLNLTTTLATLSFI